VAVPGSTSEEIAAAAGSTEFSPYNTTSYEDGHTHLALPPGAEYDYDPASSGSRPADSTCTR